MALHSRIARRIARDLFARRPGSLPALDGLRAFGCAAIVFFHCTLFSGVFIAREPDLAMRAVRYFGNALWTGVDIFFVLSGFLIGRILIQDLVRDGAIPFGRFYLRRFLRIFPAYYLVLSAALFVLGPYDIAHFGNYLIFAQAGQASPRDAWVNYLYLNNYIEPAGGDVMSWGWSLCVEEHFYLLLPTALLLVFRWRSRAGRAALLVGLTLLPLLARAVAHASGAGGGAYDFYYTSHTRFDQLLIGVLIAYAYVVYREPFRRLATRSGPALGAAGIAGILCVWTWGGLLGAGTFAAVWQFFVLALGVGLVVVNGLFLQNALTRFFAHPLWIPLARVSYGMYLVHPIVIFGCIPWFQTYWLGPRQILGLYACAMSISFLIASLLFLVVERPLLDLGARLGRPASEAARREAA